MSETLPTAPVLVIDVPQVTDVAVEFVYRKWTSDETISPPNPLSVGNSVKQPTAISESAVVTASRLLPRFCIVRWKPPNSALLPSNVAKLSIQQNVAKITFEDDFASNGFTSVRFENGQLPETLRKFVSGSLQAMNVTSVSKNLTPSDNSFVATKSTPKSIKKAFIESAIVDASANSGVVWAAKATSNLVNRVRLGLDEVDNVAVNVRVNNAFLQDVLAAAFHDPGSMNSSKLGKSLNSAASIQQISSVSQGSSNAPSAFSSLVNATNLTLGYTSTPPTVEDSQAIIGYIVEKVEITRNGDVVDHPTIFVESATQHVIVDPEIIYGSSYAYYVRTIAQVRASVIDDSTNQQALADVLFGSVPSYAALVKAVEEVAPPPPSDVGFVWNYETRRLMVTWCLPVNSQGDIKKFQVFRRTTTQEPFQLIKVYDFDDSVSPYVNGATEDFVDTNIVEHCTSPLCNFVDDDFTVDSRFIYSVCCVDAHGHSSNYSAQFEVSWDAFRNCLVKHIVSHSGAPKPYPNMYLEADAFVDAVKTNGLRRCSLHMSPEAYDIIDRNGTKEPVLITRQLAGSYTFSFINVDSQSLATVNVVVDDART